VGAEAVRKSVGCGVGPLVTGMASSRSHSRVVVYRDDAFPNIYWIEPDARKRLIQVNRDQYEVRQGRRILGVVIFHDGSTAWGWRYYPRQLGKRPSRLLHPNPEAALKGRRIAIVEVVTAAELDRSA